VSKGRLEAFSDGVIAILITIMVLNLHTPHGHYLGRAGRGSAGAAGLRPQLRLSRLYWNNHHHMLAAVSRVSGVALWANLHLLFWLSLIPFATAWMSENHFPVIPVAVYGIVLLAASLAYYALQRALLNVEGDRSLLAAAIGTDVKGKASPLMYCLGIGLSFADRWLGVAVYVAVALMWFIPDRRVERTLTEAQKDGGHSSP
jgi:uncharacterized membrane protein